MAMKSSVETVRWEKERLARENVALSEKHLRELDDARQHVRRANMDADRWRGSQDGGLRYGWTTF